MLIFHNFALIEFQRANVQVNVRFCERCMNEQKHTSQLFYVHNLRPGDYDICTAVKWQFFFEFIVMHQLLYLVHLD